MGSLILPVVESPQNTLCKANEHNPYVGAYVIQYTRDSIMNYGKGTNATISCKDSAVES